MIIKKLQSRRNFLKLLFSLSVGVIFLKIGGIASSFLLPPRKKNSYGGIVDAGDLTNLPQIGAPPQSVPDGKFWLVHTNEGILALNNSCTHLNCLFSWDKEKGVFICPCHGSEFSHYGDVIKGPADKPLLQYAISIISPDDTIVRNSADNQAGILPVQDLILHIDNPNDNQKQQRLAVWVDTSKPMTL